MGLSQWITRQRPASSQQVVLGAPAEEHSPLAADLAICPNTWAPLPEPKGSFPLVDPGLSPRDEAIALLHATAEIEHSLMVQYLYAGYSLGAVSSTDARSQKVKLIQHLFQHIAREEMAHFATMQNLLHLLGAPLHFDREHSPFSSHLLPFRFKLEPLSLGSIAKYVIAESPRPLPEDGSLTEAEINQIRTEVTSLAKASNDGICPGHVGDIFARLIWLFQRELDDSDLRPSSEQFQAGWDDWGFEPKTRNFDGVSVSGERSLVRQFSGATRKADAVKALQEIAEQGEGSDQSAGGVESHFELFWLLYRKFAELQQMSGGAPVLNVPINPNTSDEHRQASPHHKMVDTGLEAASQAGRITNARSRLWAQLFNARYRILLSQLHHFLRIDTPLYDNTGDRLARGYLASGTFNEMRRLKKIAAKLMQLPKADPSDPHRAGPPFELPYTTQIPDGEPNRWAMHVAASRGAGKLVEALLALADDSADEFLLDLKNADSADQSNMVALAAGGSLPPQSQDFPKMVRILEEAVRGFAISGPHMNFWNQKTRQEFINHTYTPITPGNASTSTLAQRLRGQGVTRMPRERPPVAGSRIDYIEAWINAGAPDSHPPYPGLTPEREPRPEGPAPLPPPAVSFAAHVRPLFRDSDISCMLAIAGFDLSKYQDVKDNAPQIFARLNDGSMPPDGRWPSSDIATFNAWMDGGFAA